MGNDKKYFYRIRNLIILTFLMNIVLCFNTIDIHKAYLIILTIIFSILYLCMNVMPLKERELNRRLKVMISGYELLIDSITAVIIETIIYIFAIKSAGKWIIIINLITALLLIFISLLNGFIRIMITSRQLGVLKRILLILFWWIPIVNLVILKSALNDVRHEYIYEKTKNIRDNTRKESEVCKTKYPVVLVHGIFFRDWWCINYWGRIPKSLIKNGCEIYYGKQQSANKIAKSASELKENIMKIINETGCKKVNIIAHSKGGLDLRYAISMLGLNEYVASLTTISTPHKGCKFVDYLLNKIPDSVQKFVDKKYNKLFMKLGDKNPDFLGGVYDLTYKNCEEFNKKVVKAEGVYYQSVGSKMSSFFSDGFPLNLGYLLSKHFDGENDGLVEVNSADFGNFTLINTSKRKGISHGDIIDLTRRDIDGFDVCELFVDIVKKLKLLGY